MFVDEIDAVGRTRGAGVGGGNDEREQVRPMLPIHLDLPQVSSHLTRDNVLTCSLSSAAARLKCCGLKQENTRSCSLPRW